ncbi:hypothetical protein F511_39014 [Dorcoceras hygrometricum]|uniref:Uncharacterized protein n=1 Tax=Dorcoceras hygrometricum TaxID=472368 RepID=A0A2Z7B2A5_9LAMI|nr:hypothetical protein F511_39014 [Dorcoceras hygrometricum]
MGGVKLNWRKNLFGILKAMVDPMTKKTNGFAVQLSLILEGLSGMQLGESKALPSLKILSVKFVGIYVANNNPSTMEVLEESKQIGEAAKAKEKRKCLRHLPSQTVSTSAPMNSTFQKLIRTTTESSQQSEDESLSLLSIPDDALPPFVTTTKPLTKIGRSQHIEIREVNWLVRSLPKIAPEAKGKQILVEELDAMRKEVQDQKAAITNYLLEFHVEAHENFQTLSTQLSEIIAYINRGRDDKKGEGSSSRGPQPPNDQSRPGSGGGSRREPPRKRGGGSNRGGGRTSSRGFRYWFGE